MSLSSQVDYAQPDVRPATVATTISSASALAGINLRTISGCPPAPTCAIEATSVGGVGFVLVTLAGGGQAKIILPDGIPQFRRLAAVSIDATSSLGTGNAVAYWGSEYNKNA